MVGHPAHHHPQAGAAVVARRGIALHCYPRTDRAGELTLSEDGDLIPRISGLHP